MVKLIKIDPNSIKFAISSLEFLRQRSYIPLSLRFILVKSQSQREYFTVTDYDSFKIEVLNIVEFNELQGNTILLLDSLNLRIDNLNKYNVIFNVRLYADLFTNTDIREKFDLNNFTNEIAEREIERYKQFLQNLSLLYKFDIGETFDVLNSENNNFELDPVYYVNNVPEYMESQLDYVKKQIF